MDAFAQLTRLVFELARAKRGGRLLRLEFGTQAVDLLLEQVALKLGLLYALDVRRRRGSPGSLVGSINALHMRGGPPLGRTVIRKRGSPPLAIRALRTQGGLPLECSATSRSNPPLSLGTSAFCMRGDPSGGHAAVHDFPLGCDLPGRRRLRRSARLLTG